MKASIEVAEIGINKMREKLKAGMTEDELWSILHKTNIEHGGNGLNVEFYLQAREQIHGCKKVVTKLFKVEK